MPPLPFRPLHALAAMTMLGGVLAVLGPFGSYLNGPLGERLVYWVGSCWLGLGLYGLVVWQAMSLPEGAPRWGGLLGGTLLASGVETGLSHTLAVALWPGLSLKGPSLALWFAQTLLIGTLLTLGAGWALSQRQRATRPAIASPLEDIPAPLPFAGQVLALQMDDHYVHVHGAQGSRMVLMPLGKAIAALGPREGLRTHRSWWVAREAVAEVLGTPRAMRLRLHNGLEAPVSRSAVASLRQAGWLENPQLRA